MKRTIAVAKQVQAAETQARAVAGLEAKIDKLLDHFGLSEKKVGAVHEDAHDAPPPAPKVPVKAAPKPPAPPEKPKG